MDIVFQYNFTTLDGDGVVCQTVDVRIQKGNLGINA